MFVNLLPDVSFVFIVVSFLSLPCVFHLSTEGSVGCWCQGTKIIKYVSGVFLAMEMRDGFSHGSSPGSVVEAAPQARPEDHFKCKNCGMPLFFLEQTFSMCFPFHC